MPKAGFEPARPFGHSDLNAACLPFHHLGILGLAPYTEDKARTLSSFQACHISVPSGHLSLRELDLNQRPLGYEPSELPNCSTARRLVLRPVEIGGFEPPTFCMPCRRATNCAISPCLVLVYRRHQHYLRTHMQVFRYLRVIVGVTGFEPATSRSQSGRSSQAELYPDNSSPR